MVSDADHLKAATELQKHLLPVLQSEPFSVGITAMANLFVGQAMESADPAMKDHILTVLKQAVQYIEGGPEVVRLGRLPQPGETH